jgi:hypothetical protein
VVAAAAAIYTRAQARAAIEQNRIHTTPIFSINEAHTNPTAGPGEVIRLRLTCETSPSALRTTRVEIAAGGLRDLKAEEHGPFGPSVDLGPVKVGTPVEFYGVVSGSEPTADLRVVSTGEFGEWVTLTSVNLPPARDTFRFL